MLFRSRITTKQMWIGAIYIVEFNTVHVEIDADRIQSLKTRISEALAAKGLVFNLRPLAGELSWVAGIVPRMRPFVSNLWAAIHETHNEQTRASRGDSKARARPKDAVFLRRVDHSLRWLHKFFKGEVGPVRRTYTLKERGATPCFTFGEMHPHRGWVVLC